MGNELSPVFTPRRYRVLQHRLGSYYDRGWSRSSKEEEREQVGQLRAKVMIISRFAQNVLPVQAPLVVLCECALHGARWAFGIDPPKSLCDRPTGRSAQTVRLQHT